MHTLTFTHVHTHIHACADGVNASVWMDLRVGIHMAGLPWWLSDKESAC